MTVLLEGQDYGRVRARVLQTVLLTWRNGNLCTAQADFQEHIRFR